MMEEFKIGESVLHIKTGRVYKIIGTPTHSMRLEHCNEPFYIYQDKDGIGTMWCRQKSEMEDGRFKKHPLDVPK